MHIFPKPAIQDGTLCFPAKYPREAGVLLAVSSLPSPYGIGTLGEAAYAFVDFLHDAGQAYWQVLPVGPTSFGDSPYQSFSSFAGNPYLIDLDFLREQGLLTLEEIQEDTQNDPPDRVDYAFLFAHRLRLLEKAFARSKPVQEPGYRVFCTENAGWLEDYSLYMALKVHFAYRPWWEWEEDIRLRRPLAVRQYRRLLLEGVEFWKFCQYHFSVQWEALRRYASRKGVRILGDLPLYAALDSADVWASQSQFQLGRDGLPTAVAGVPPDAFSETGQRWGNPLYRWDRMEKDGFSWWKCRLKAAARQYDWVRLDHFIGIVQYFSIPAGEETAVHGEWKPGPGGKLTALVNHVVGAGRVIAEDLGALTPEVIRLREKMGYPGMKVLQFGFDGNPDNGHLPDHYKENTVAYGGTHDNDTLLGFFGALEPGRQQEVLKYFGVSSPRELPDAVIETVYASRARMVIFQAQDILGLSGEARMNLPSTLGGNWQWRLLPGQTTQEAAQKLRRLTRRYLR